MPFPDRALQGDPGARTPADGESAPGARRACSRVAWSTGGAPKGQVEIVPCTLKWSDPSHGPF